MVLSPSYVVHIVPTTAYMVDFFYKNNRKILKLKIRRGVAPVIATLLMVAIAVVGGTIIFVFSQEFFSDAQVSGFSEMEFLKIEGYDGRDVAQLDAHDDSPMLAGSGGVQDNLKQVGERMAVYITNHSVDRVTITEVRFNGDLYTFNNGVATLDTFVGATAPTLGGYVLLIDPSTNGLLNSDVPFLEPGQTVTIVLGITENIKVGRDTQIRIETQVGTVFLGTVVGEKAI